MTAVPTSETESQDADQVNQALAAIAAGDVATAEAALLKVIANTPAEYINQSEDADGSLSIKFWDQNDFVHYVMWQKQQGVTRGVRWEGNAYPRAYYYLGFLCVKTRRPRQAIEYLDRGHQLEPTNPKFKFEKAQALVQASECEQALALYETVTDIGPHISAWDLAVARRGRGFVLIELGRLQQAEAAFLSSLEIEPDNPVALNELQYIAHLRRGGKVSHSEAVQRQAPTLSECALCGNKFSKGVVVMLNGIPRSVCEKCEGKRTKKWWQFWK
jgi:tetratricopeptide (TPR) repeat protein